MIEQDTHLHSPLVYAFHCSKNALSFFVKAQCEILDVNETLRMIDLLSDTRDIRKVVRKEFDGISCKGRKATKIRIELDKWFVAGQNRRVQERVKLFLALSCTHRFGNSVSHGALHCTTALRQLGTADEEEHDDPQNRYYIHEQEPGGRR